MKTPLGCGWDGLLGTWSQTLPLAPLLWASGQRELRGVAGLAARSPSAGRFPLRAAAARLSREPCVRE